MINYDTTYYIDDDNKIYVLSELPKDDTVREFIEANLTPISHQEIEDNMQEIRDMYEDNGHGDPIIYSYDQEYISLEYQYDDDENYINLQELSERIDEEHILIYKGDETYNKFIREMEIVYNYGK